MSSYILNILKDIFKAPNLLIIFLTSFFFMCIFILFFWYKLSNQFEHVITDKVELLSIYAKNDLLFRQRLLDYINQIDISKLKEEADKNEEIRKNIPNGSNFKILMSTGILYYVIIVGSISVLLFIYTLVTRKLNAVYTILLFLVIMSFVPELIIFFVMIENWKFIGDDEAIKKLMKGL